MSGGKQFELGAPLGEGSWRALLEQRVDLGATQTPLEPLSILQEAFPDGPRLWMKRDDFMSRGLGGNKLRKLEYLVATEEGRRATHVGTIGAPSSNHLRLTACAAALMGKKCVLYVTGDPDPTRGGNPKLLGLLGAEVVPVSGTDDFAQVDARCREDLADRARRDGGEAAWIPIGGASMRGDLAFVRCAQELAAQCDSRGFRPTKLFVGAAIGGTAAGLAVGAAAFLPGAEVVAYAVNPQGSLGYIGLPPIPAQIDALAAELSRHGMPRSQVTFRLEYGQVGRGYADPTAAGQEALELLARTEAIFVDPVYTSKVFAGLLQELRSASGRRDEAWIFLHTGGLPGLFRQEPPSSAPPAGRLMRKAKTTS